GRQFREPDVRAHAIARRAGVLRRPRPFEPAAADRHATHDGLDVGAHVREVLAPVRQARPQRARLPAVERDWLLDADRRAKRDVRDAARAAQRRDFLANARRDIDARVDELGPVGVFGDDLCTVPRLDGGTSNTELAGRFRHGVQRPKQVDPRGGVLGQAHAARRDDAVADLQLRPEPEADRAVLVDEDAVARGDADRAAVGRADFVELLGQRMADDGADGTEADFVAFDAEAEHLAEAVAGAPLAVRVARRRLRERPVDEVADARHPDAPRVAHEHVLASVDAHDDHLAVAQLLDREVVGADAGAERGDDRADLLVAEHAVEARLLDVQDLAAQREDRLGPPVARLLRRATGRIALDQEDLGVLGLARLAVGELAGQAAADHRALADEVALLAGRLARAHRQQRLVDDRLRLARVLLEELAELVVDDRLHRALDLRVAELDLGLALEQRVGHEHRDHGREPLAEVLAGRRRLALLDEAFLLRVGVERARERAAEAGEVRAALVRVDVVREAVDVFVVAVVVLQRDLDDELVDLLVQVDDRRVDRRLVLVHVLDEGLHALRELERLGLAAALVGDDDREAARAKQVGELAQPLRDRLVGERRVGLEDLAVGLEGDLGPALGRLAELLQRGGRVAAAERHVVDLVVAADLDLEPLGERVHDRRADAV